MASEFELQQSLALPKATKRLMLWLPVFGVAISQTFGLNPFAGFSNPLGVFAFGLAIFLLFAGDKLAEKMIANLEKVSSDDNLALLLFSVALKAGISLSEAKSFLQKKFPKQNFDLDSHIEFAAATGAPISKLLVSTAQENHEAKTSKAIQEAKALSVKLLIPLGLTVLPAFLLLTVVPILISQITN
jgi:tight adherence protein B